MTQWQSPMVFDDPFLLFSCSFSFKRRTKVDVKNWQALEFFMVSKLLIPPFQVSFSFKKCSSSATLAIDGKVKLKPTHDVKNDVIFEEDDEEWDPDDEDDDDNDSSDDDSSDDDYTYTSNDSDWCLTYLNKYLHIPCYLSDGFVKFTL